MNRISQRFWYALLALAIVWIIAYWLTPGPSAPVVSTPNELRQAADRAEPSDDERPDLASPRVEPFVTLAARPNRSLAPITSTEQTTLDPTTPTPPQPAIIPPTFQIYTVATGDTMSSVAERFYGTPQYAGQIARANPTVDPIRLRAGTELRIPTDPRNIQGIPADPALQPGDPEPAFIEYVVTRGDTLSEIARSFYGRSALWTHIRDANPSINRDATNIRPGMTIRIPPPPR